MRFSTCTLYTQRWHSSSAISGMEFWAAGTWRLPSRTRLQYVRCARRLQPLHRLAKDSRQCPHLQFSSSEDRWYQWNVRPAFIFKTTTSMQAAAAVELIVCRKLDPHNTFVIHRMVIVTSEEPDFFLPTASTSKSSPADFKILPVDSSFKAYKWNKDRKLISCSIQCGIANDGNLVYLWKVYSIVLVQHSVEEGKWVCSLKIQVQDDWRSSTNTRKRFSRERQSSSKWASAENWISATEKAQLSKLLQYISCRCNKEEGTVVQQERRYCHVFKNKKVRENIRCHL